MMINSIPLSILPALLFLVASIISPECLAFSIQTHIYSSYPWQRLTTLTGQRWKRQNGSPHHLLGYSDDNNDDRTFPLPTMNLSGDIRAPDGKTVDINHQLDRILALKDMFGQSQDASPNGVNERFEPPPKNVRESKTSASLSFAPKLSPAINHVVEKPSKDVTGVEPYVTSICATISQQIYEATSIDCFDLIDKNDKTIAAEVIIFDNHGILNDLVPPFAVAVSGDIMILAWRGSHTIMDWASDFSASPVTSSRWRHISEYVKAHSAFAAMVESDMAQHEDALIEAIQRYEIKQLLTTGHSLAGGMAQVSHVFLEGQLQQNGSKWNKLLGHLTVRSIGFAAPMTIMSTVDFANLDKITLPILQKISDNSCNIVYGPDVVPHSYGDTNYIIEVIEALIIPDFATDVPSWSAWALRLLGIRSKLMDMFKNLTEKDEGVSTLLKVMTQYHHLGKIIHYADKSSTPVVLRDNRFQALTLPSFRGYSRIKVPTETRTEGSVENQLMNAHLFFPSALAYNLLHEKQGTK